MAVNFETLLKKCDVAIRHGRPREAADLLNHVNTAKLPRQWRLPFASACRRCGLYSLGIRVLFPLVSETGDATAGEMAEYGVLLLRFGAPAESLERLYGLEAHLAPEALLYRAYAHFARWEYDKAIPNLQEYLRFPLSHHQSAVGKVNLVFAYAEIYRNEEGLRLLTDLFAGLDENEHFQLRTNCYALQAQIHLQEGELAKARLAMNSARVADPTVETNDQLLFSKWNLILRGLETKDTRYFDELRTLAHRRRTWESLREADLYSLKVRFDRARFLHLYFGTPFDGFRERLKRELGMQPSQPVYVLGEKSTPRFDLRTARLEDRPAGTPGCQEHQLLEILLRDFYKPLRLPGLFAAFFPEEYFNIETSPDRVHQILRRTRKWLKDQRIPVSIEETDGFYSVKIEGPISFRVPLEKEKVDFLSAQYHRLSQAFGGKKFTVEEMIVKLELSKTTVRQLLRREIESGRIVPAGRDKRAMEYRIAGGQYRPGVPVVRQAS